MKALTKFMRDERGMETVEYAVMTALIVAALIAAIAALRTAIQGRFNSVAGTINGLN